MIRLLILLCLIFNLNVYAEVGRVLAVKGVGAQLIRKGKSSSLGKLKEIRPGDVVQTSASKILLVLYPSTQISLAEGSRLIIKEQTFQNSKGQERIQGSIEFLKGSGRFLVYKDTKQDVEFRVETEGVVFSVRGTEFEVALGEKGGIDLNVLTGQVEASSPYVQSFVPEMIKTKESIHFDLKKKIFVKRNYSPLSIKFIKFEDGKSHLGAWRKKAN